MAMAPNLVLHATPLCMDMLCTPWKQLQHQQILGPSSYRAQFTCPMPSVPRNTTLSQSLLHTGHIIVERTDSTPKGRLGRPRPRVDWLHTSADGARGTAVEEIEDSL